MEKICWMEKKNRNSLEGTVLARFNALSGKKQLDKIIFILLPFVLVHLIIYSKTSYHPWWIYLIFTLILLINRVLLSSKEICFLDSRELVISQKIGSDKIYKFEQLYFHKSNGGARSTFYKLIILRRKKDDFIVFRIPLDSDEEEEKVISFLQQKCGINLRKWNM